MSGILFFIFASCHPLKTLETIWPSLKMTLFKMKHICTFSKVSVKVINSLHIIILGNLESIHICHYVRGILILFKSNRCLKNLEKLREYVVYVVIILL